MGIIKINYRLTPTEFSKFFIIISIFSILWIPANLNAAHPSMLSTSDLSPMDKFILSSRNPQIDVFRVGYGVQPLFIPNIEAMPLHPDTKKILEQEERLKELVDHVNSLKKQRAAEGYAIDGYKDPNQFILNSSPSISAVTGIQRAIVLMVDFLTLKIHH